MLEEISLAGMSRGEWLAERRNSIGGSDVGALLGLNKYRSPYSVWAEKTGRLAEPPDNEAMRQGRDLEEYVAMRFMERSGKKARRYNFLLRNPGFPHLHANIDRRLVGERAGLECKTASALAMKDYADGSFPESYYAQCVSYLAVTGWERWYLAALVLNKALFVYQLTTVEDDPVPEWCDGGVYVPPSETAALGELVESFWTQYVEKDAPPPPDGSGPTTEAIKAVLGEDTGGEAGLFGREGLLKKYSSLIEEKKALEAGLEEIRQALMLDMGSASVGYCGAYKVSWKAQIRRTLDVKKLRELYPDINLEPCYKVTKTRPFKITEEN